MSVWASQGAAVPRKEKRGHSEGLSREKGALLVKSLTPFNIYLLAPQVLLVGNQISSS